MLLFSFDLGIIILQLAPFDPTKKKKKKKNVAQDLVDDSLDKLAEKTESLSGWMIFLILFSSILIWHLPNLNLNTFFISPPPAVSDGLDSTFTGLKKKKKKPVSY